MHRPRTRLLLLLLPLLTGALSLPLVSAHAAPTHQGRATDTISLKPGESGRVVMTIDDPTSEVKQLVLEVSNTQAALPNDAIAPLASSSCAGRITAYGPVGNTLYWWQSVQFYTFTGSTVTLDSNFGSYDTAYGWYFVRQGYINSGSGTWNAKATSVGYFKHATTAVQNAGEVHFSITGNGNCSAWGNTRAW